MLFEVRLVPALSSLKRSFGSRIFQDKRVFEVVGAVLAQASVKHEFRLFGDYPVLDYCVQHEETAFAFVTRLLAESAMFYFFDHPDGAASTGEPEVIIITDSARGYAPLSGEKALRYRQASTTDAALLPEDSVTSIGSQRTARSTAVLLRDYDFLRPMAELSFKSTATSPEVSHSRVYHHHGDYEGGNMDAIPATSRLEQIRRRAEMTSGTSTCRRLTPGAVFDLVGHPVTSMDRTYAVVRVDHRGSATRLAEQPVTYETKFECVPSDVAFRPKPQRRKSRQVTETAIVVGPTGHEIHTDRHGRIKVQFHWDIDGQRNEDSSCWIRVCQPWTGAAWGAQFIPRIGMEVLVTFWVGISIAPSSSVASAMRSRHHPFLCPRTRHEAASARNLPPAAKATTS